MSTCKRFQIHASFDASKLKMNSNSFDTSFAMNCAPADMEEPESSWLFESEVPDTQTLDIRWVTKNQIRERHCCWRQRMKELEQSNCPILMNLPYEETKLRKKSSEMCITKYKNLLLQYRFWVHGSCWRQYAFNSNQNGSSATQVNAFYKSSPCQ